MREENKGTIILVLLVIIGFGVPMELETGTRKYLILDTTQWSCSLERLKEDWDSSSF